MYRRLWLVLCLLICLNGEHILADNTLTLTITPDKATYLPGEIVTLNITASGGTQVQVDIFHLAETLTTLEGTAAETLTLSWQPPTEARRGYGATARLLDNNGAVIATAETAFDVLDSWIQAPRYGFLSEFGPDRDNAAETMALLTRYHVNGLQFYDWQYRHEQLMPPTETYTDPLDRQLSLSTINSLINAAHDRNIAAMPYTAIYGATPPFFQGHPEWALLDSADQPYDFADGFLYIMDPSPDSPWTAHLMEQFADVLAQTDFDGIHLDQYGAPKVGRSTTGERVDLAEAFPDFINQMAAVVYEQRGDKGVSIFNAVGNWPVETVAPSDQDVVYIEVWSPYTSFMDLHRLVANAEKLGGGKPVIIAAYISPEQPINVRLANALIFGSGGYHLELGEPNAMLADPYFPLFGTMDDALQDIVAKTYDFAVRYEELLSLETTDATSERAAALTIDGVRTNGIRAQDRVAVIVRQGVNREIFNLINLMGIDGSRWDEPLTIPPTTLTDLSIQVAVTGPVQQVWWATPDSDSAALQPLTFTTSESDTEHTITLTLPRLNYWDMLVIEYANANGATDE